MSEIVNGVLGLYVITIHFEQKATTDALHPRGKPV